MDSAAGSDTDRARRVRQQEVVAELGRAALETDDFEPLLHEAAAAVAETFETEFAAVFELQPDGEALRLRRGVGWRDGVVDTATIPTGPHSQAGFTLAVGEPVIVDDRSAADRFSTSALLADHDVESGVSVVIGPVADPWGVLATYTPERREFSAHDATILRSVAAVLGSAIERTAAERALRERESELEQTFDRITDGFIGLDADWTITYTNERGKEILDLDDEGLVGENFWDVFEPALGTTFEDEYRTAVRTQEPTSFEAYYPPLGVWFEVHAYPSESGLSIYFQDITERRERERKLEESEHRYRTLAECFPNGLVTLFDEELEYTLAAGRGFEKLPVTPDEVEDGTPRETWGAAVAADLVPAMESALDGDETAVEVSYADREWVVHAVPVATEAGDIFAGMTMAQDITERKRIERDLRESEERFRQIAENLESVIWFSTPDMREYLYVNPAYDEVWGRDRRELYEDPTAFIQAIHPDDRDRVREALPDQIDGEYDEQYRVIQPDGEVRWVRDRAFPIEDDAGSVHRIVGIAEDVTEQRARRRQLEESNERLEQFAYAASHDLQEPLRMVSSYLQLLGSRFGDELDAEGEEFLDFAIDGADRMRAMINGLLEYSRVDTQGDPLEPVDLDAVLDDALENLQVRIEQRDTEITAESLPRVAGDESQLQQLLQNLLSNAIKYAGEEPPRIHVEAERSGRQWEVSVRDEGIGIDPADHDRIFDIFHRLHTRDEHPGTGIGLALCQRIVERHGGDIWVDSEPGDGSTFSFTLPAVSER